MTNKKVFGDFQTPFNLARQICTLLFQQGISPTTIVEPTCGLGSFILASLECFPEARTIFGVDLNPNHIEVLKQELRIRNAVDKAEIAHHNFFDLDWDAILAKFSEPLLIIGNPPWVTNSTLGALNSQNLPEKTNFHGYTGLDALTGKSNFDISEWMLLHLIQQMKDRDSVLAMLIKTSVARKVLKYLWKNKIAIGSAYIYLLDGKQTFGVAVDICLFVYRTNGGDQSQICHVHQGLNADVLLTTFGFSDGHLVANIKRYHQWKHLTTKGKKRYQWRSGVKHDAAKVMELSHHTTSYKNGLGETYILEDDYVYPLLKGSDVAKGSVNEPGRWLLVPQTYVGENTIHIKHKAPKTWAYLIDHEALFDQRKSSIYKNKPKFSIFGVGDYSFAPWKVAISGLHKTLRFVAIGPYQDQPVMLDDTCYFIPCASQSEADLLVKLLNSSVAQEFFSAFIFWDSKRPITANILNNLDLLSLAEELNLKADLEKQSQSKQATQLSLLSL